MGRRGKEMDDKSSLPHYTVNCITTLGVALFLVQVHLLMEISFFKV